MKKALLLSLVLVLCLGGAFAEKFSKNGMLLAPGDLSVNAGVGYGWSWGMYLGGGAEFTIGKFELAKELPFSYGVAGRAGAYLGGYSGLELAVGAMGTLHFCWGAIAWPEGLEWLDNVDTYIGIGLSIQPASKNDFIRLNSIGGTSYFFSKNLAVNVESGLMASTFGILMKL